MKFTTSSSTTARSTLPRLEVLFGLAPPLETSLGSATTGSVSSLLPRLLSALQKYATTGEIVDALRWAVVSICSCCHNPAGLKLFATNEFIAALKNAEEYATDLSSKNELDKCLELLEDFLTQNSQRTHENDNDQSGGSGGNVASSSAVTQHQQELDEALQKIAALSSQLQEEKQKSSDLENELQKLKEQNQK